MLSKIKWEPGLKMAILTPNMGKSLFLRTKFRSKIKYFWSKFGNFDLNQGQTIRKNANSWVIGTQGHKLLNKHAFSGTLLIIREYDHSLIL